MGPAARTGPINLVHSQRKLSFFHLPSELKHNHNCRIVLPPVCRGYNSELADRASRGWGGRQWTLRREVNKVVYFRLNENWGAVGKCPTDPQIYVFIYPKNASLCLKPTAHTSPLNVTSEITALTCHEWDALL